VAPNAGRENLTTTTPKKNLNNPAKYFYYFINIVKIMFIFAGRKK
jgi:hypothetical protein